jgi:Replication-relaxation
MRKTVKEGRPRKVSDAQIAAAASRLTQRDRQIALDCYEHQVLTTAQLNRLHFTSNRATLYRLDALYSMRVLDRVRPYWQRGEGSTPYHWLLDETGAHIVAAEHGIERRELRWRHTTALGIATSATLRHRVETNEFFTLLAEQAATAHGALTQWYGERTTHGLLEGIAKPDGYGTLVLPGQAPLHLLLELDRGTETIDRLRDKAERYAQAIPRGPLRHTNPLVLLAVPSVARAQTAAAAIANTGAPFAVVVWSAQSDTSALAVTLAAVDHLDAGEHETFIHKNGSHLVEQREGGGNV